MIEIREERPEDYDTIRFINDQAFGTPEEGRIVDKLREVCEGTISLVAVSGEKVSGHIHYYPRFGFERASKYRLKCQWEGLPDEGFMVMILNKSVMAGVSGTARYRSEWDEAVTEIPEV